MLFPLNFVIRRRGARAMILETRHLQLIAAIAEHGTLGRAGHDLNLTQSGVSHQLGSLEARFGVTLFHRMGRRMAITPAGSRLLLAAQRTLGELRDAEEDIRNAAEGRLAVLRVSAECYTSYHWLPRVIKGFAESEPGVEIRVVPEVSGDPIGALRDRRIDVAVMLNRVSGPGLRAVPLFDDEIIVLTSREHPFAGKAHVELHELAAEHLLSYSSLEKQDSYLGNLLRAEGCPAKHVSSVQLTEAILEMVNAGIGVAALARWAVAPVAVRYGLALVPLTSRGLHRTWHAVSLRKPDSADYIREFTRLMAPGPKLLEQRATTTRQSVPRRWRAAQGSAATG